MGEGDPRGLPELKEDIASRDATPEQVAFAERAVSVARDVVGDDLLYARVDVVTGPDGDLRLMELELTEPSFFLDHTPTGAAAFAAALQRRLGI